MLSGDAHEEGYGPLTGCGILQARRLEVMIFLDVMSRNRTGCPRGYICPVRQVACWAVGSVHAGAPSSFGSRMRLAAVAVGVSIHAMRPRPRCLVFRKPAVALIQPNGSSVRFRMRWLIA